MHDAWRKCFAKKHAFMQEYVDQHGIDRTDECRLTEQPKSGCAVRACSVV
jgi:hypothetical protein